MTPPLTCGRGNSNRHSRGRWKEGRDIDDVSNQNGYVENKSGFQSPNKVDSLDGVSSDVDADAITTCYLTLRDISKSKSKIRGIEFGDAHDSMVTRKGLREWSDILMFREAIDDCGLEDMRFVGDKFTWSNRKDGTAKILEILDRCFCNRYFLFRQSVSGKHGQNPQWYPIRVPSQISRLLDAKFTADEIQKVVFEMNPLKAPRKKEFLDIFYQKFWGTIGQKVASVCLRVEEEKEEERVFGFKAGHVKGVRSCRVEFFFKQLIGKMGFFEKWACLVTDCVETVIYSFKINVEIVRNISPSRGVKQGDPLSRYGSIVSEIADLRMGSKREAIDDCGLEDMGFVGDKFTWSSRRDGTAEILEILDRCFCNRKHGQNPQWNQISRLLDAKLTTEEIQKVVFEMNPLKAPGKDGFLVIFYQFFEEPLVEEVKEEERVFGFKAGHVKGVRSCRVEFKTIDRQDGVLRKMGFVMASCSQFVMASLDTQVAGILAILRGILFNKDCGLYPCVVEADKLEAVNRVLLDNFRHASYGFIVSEIADLCFVKKDKIC
ncbi:hypothetical protein Ddye_007510 [Dipteronia dyeriana]|uniref:Reverse transcriptase n=1 Tax=Dipteronia dyeriana TaxID=168575 RepID=A0AAD9XKP8_9ROSI|nr:hypothetical protein Ddye_007510 [Dipteronia dyeriana]